MTATVDVSAIVDARDGGRALVPTLRSLRFAVARTGVALEVVIVTTAAGRPAVDAWVLAEDDATLATQVITAGPDEAHPSPVAVRAARASTIALLTAGDLIGESWLAGAAAALRGSDAPVILHPEVVVAHGRRRGIWSQPDSRSADVREGLPARVDMWSHIAMASRSVLDALPAVGAPPSVAGSTLPLVALGSGVRHAIVPGTIGFQRVWTDAAPVTRDPRLLLPPVAYLSDASNALAGSTVPPVSRVRRALRRDARLARVARVGARAVRAVSAPWVRGARLAAGGLRGGFPEWMLREWRDQNALEPLIPFPRRDIAWRLERWGVVWPAADRRAAAAYWRVVAALPARLDYLYFAPWVSMGGGDRVLSQYLRAVRDLDPSASIALVTTEPVASTRLGSLPDGVHILELRDLCGPEVGREDIVEWLLPQVIAQLRPATIHAFNSTVAYDVIERFGAAIAAHSHIFLSTFAIDRTHDGERTSVMFLREPGFLDAVDGVLVDSEYYARTMAREQGYDAASFRVQRQIVETVDRQRTEPAGFGADRPLRLVWAGRFDLPKRIDILARVATEARRLGMPVDVQFYGEEVMGDHTAPQSLAALESAGATRHPAYEGFASLPLASIDALIMTSEWEGVPSVLLEAMGAGIPVIAPVIGGIGEVLTAETGHPVAAFDDVDGYIAAIRALIDDYPEALRRAERARRLIESEFSEARFEERLRGISGYLR